MFLYILESPVVAMAPLDAHVVIGNTVTLQCGFTSAIAVNITWTKQELPSLQRVIITADNRINISKSGNTGQLVIRNTISDDNGLYSCTGVSVAGTAIAAAEVIVGSKQSLDE